MVDTLNSDNEAARMQLRETLCTKRISLTESELASAGYELHQRFLGWFHGLPPSSDIDTPLNIGAYNAVRGEMPLTTLLSELQARSCHLATGDH